MLFFAEAAPQTALTPVFLISPNSRGTECCTSELDHELFFVMQSVTDTSYAKQYQQRDPHPTSKKSRLPQTPESDHITGTCLTRDPDPGNQMSSGPQRQTT